MWEKEEIMTNVITNIEDMIKTEEIDVNNSNPKAMILLNFLRIKALAKGSKEKIDKYTEKNKNVRNGRTVLTGTRITTKELLYIIGECKENQDIFEYIFEQYPSIDCKEKIIYGLLYEIGKTNSLIYTLRILIEKNENIM